MRKAVLPFRVLITGVLIFFSAQFIGAQEPEPVPEQEEYNLTINEVLDRVEESFNARKEDLVPVVVDDESVDGIGSKKRFNEDGENHFDPSADQSVEDLQEIKGEELFSEPVMTEPAKPAVDAKPLGGVEYSVEIIEVPEPEPEEVQETKIIPLWHAEASGILEMLNDMKSSDGEVAYNEEDRTLILVDFPGPLEAMSAFIRERDILLETEVFKLEYIKGQDMIGHIEKVLTENVGQVQFHERDNSIAVTDTPVKIGEIKELMARKDHINKMVLIEIKILQIVLSDEHIMGVDWEATVSDYQKLLFPGFKKKTGSQGNDQLNMGTVSEEDYEILLEALDTVGVIRTTSDQIMKVENTAEGIVTVYPLLLKNPHEEDSASGSSEDHHADLSDEWLHGKKIRFHLSPTINRDKKIAVFVKPELVGMIPVSSEETSQEGVVIKVDDGATIVIGSLFEEVMVESTSKVPLLGDLPLLGFVFRNQGEELRKTEVITFLTVKTVEKN